MAAAAQLSLALFAGAHASRPLPRLLGWLCADVFAWNAAELAESWTGDPTWDRLDHAAASLTMPLVLEFVLVFAGERQRSHRVRFAAWTYGGATAIGAALGMRPDWWTAVVLAGALLGSVEAIRHLVAHLRRNADAMERRRVRGILAAIVVGAAFSLTELFANLDLPITRLSHVGTLASTVMLARVALAGQLIEPSKKAVAASLVVLAVFLCGALVWAPRHAGGMLLAFLAVLGTFVSITALLPALAFRIQHARRRDDLAFLGRMSAQMAHDMKNPITAIRGAADFLLLEIDRGRAVPRQMIELVREQSDRLAQLADTYLRLGRIEPERTAQSGRALVEPLLRALVPAGDIEVAVEERPPADICVDAELFELALENVIRNAVEAIGGARARPSPGRIEVVIEPRSISITDSGAGMDPRTCERAGELFFTTKARGSGLGLALARRVAEAHGGRLDIHSVLGRGTTVRIGFSPE